MGKKFWQFKNTIENGAELLLYGEIQSERSWWDPDNGGIFADEFVQDLQTLGDVPEITVRINSVGGDIFAAVAIYTELKTNPAKINCIIDGLAASAATFILMAADPGCIQIPYGAMVMIHDPLAVLMGMYNADDLEQQGKALAAIKTSIVSIYASRTGLDEDTISDLMSGTTWMDADESVQNGFADAILGEEINVQMKGKVLYMNGVKHDLSGLEKMPELKHAKKIMDTIAGDNIAKKFVAIAGSAQNAASGKEWACGCGAQNTGSYCPNCGAAKPVASSGKQSNTAAQRASTASKPAGTPGQGIAFTDEIGTVDDTAHAENVNAFMALYPNFLTRLVNEAQAQERKRIAEIDDIAGQVSPALVKKAKYEEPMEAKDIAFEQMKTQKASGSQFLSGFAKDTAESGVNGIGAAPAPQADETDDQQRASLGENVAKFANKFIGR